jgi:hypothetical protein
MICGGGHFDEISPYLLVSNHSDGLNFNSHGVFYCIGFKTHLQPSLFSSGTLERKVAINT